MKLMIIGDTHGVKQFLEPKLQDAKRLGIQRVLVVGDFGVWTHSAGGHAFLDSINVVANVLDMQIFAIGGNHENWDHWNWYTENMPKSKGWAYIRSNVLIAPKVHTWSWANRVFVGAGGAVSIDKAERLSDEAGVVFVSSDGFLRRRGGTGDRTQWWPDEQLTEADLASIQAMNIKANYLITHDASDHTNWGFDLVPDYESQLHRQRIDKVIAAVKPEMHFHGHMHKKFDWVNTASHGQRNTAFGYDDSEWNGQQTHTYGLDCNGTANSWGVLDLNNDKYTWGPDVVFKR